ncbi:MAG: type II toxin-antitoxin system RelE/ParE family toxin [Prevotella sp.]|nr:type II toxin-antitoxin system RelE/ParE family toxin [Prevotella sp.]
MATIIWQNTAKKQLIENITYALAEFGETTANRWEKDVKAVEWRLKRHSVSYPLESLLSSRQKEYRYCHVMHRRFKIIYFYDNVKDVVTIMDIWDTRMNPSALIRRIK